MPIHFLLFFTSLYSLWLHYVCSVVKEELAEDDALLPQVNGRVVCWVSTSLYYGVCVMSMLCGAQVQSIFCEGFSDHHGHCSVVNC